MLQIVSKGFDVGITGRRLACAFAGQWHADVGAGITLILDGAIDTDLIPGIDQGVCQLDADFEGVAAANAGAADAVVLAGVQLASTGPVGQVLVVLGLFLPATQRVFWYWPLASVT
nr:hypothetical protein GCM10020185_81310 [Pseudomonas brassicacearum subsp. brassicacearum]